MKSLAEWVKTAHFACGKVLWVHMHTHTNYIKYVWLHCLAGASMEQTIVFRWNVRSFFHEVEFTSCWKSFFFFPCSPSKFVCSIGYLCVFGIELLFKMYNKYFFLVCIWPSQMFHSFIHIVSFFFHCHIFFGFRLLGCAFNSFILDF